MFVGVEGCGGEARKFEALNPDCSNSCDVAGWTEKSDRCTDAPGDELEVLLDDGTLNPPIDAL